MQLATSFVNHSLDVAALAQRLGFNFPPAALPLMIRNLYRESDEVTWNLLSVLDSIELVHQDMQGLLQQRSLDLCLLHKSFTAALEICAAVAQLLTCVAAIREKSFLQAGTDCISAFLGVLNQLGLQGDSTPMTLLNEASTSLVRNLELLRLQAAHPEVAQRGRREHCSVQLPKDFHEQVRALRQRIVGLQDTLARVSHQAQEALAQMAPQAHRAPSADSDHWDSLYGTDGNMSSTGYVMPEQPTRPTPPPLASMAPAAPRPGLAATTVKKGPQQRWLPVGHERWKPQPATGKPPTTLVEAATAPQENYADYWHGLHGL
jgi:hypothetical protein